MAKTTLIERMEKKGAPKSWIKEVDTKDLIIKQLSLKSGEYLGVIDTLARERVQLLAEVAELQSCIEVMQHANIGYAEKNEALRDNYEKVKAALAAMLMRHGEHGNLTREQLEDYVGDALPAGGNDETE